MKTNQLLEATILFAGDSGDGMQLTGSQFTQTSALLGNDVSTLPDFPAEIRAPQGTLSGVSGFQIHFGSIPIHSPGDKYDVLVAMNAAALLKNVEGLKPQGIIIANTSGFDAKNLRLAKTEENPLEKYKNQFNIFEIDITKNTQEALAHFDLSSNVKQRSKNMFALGFVYWLYSRPLDYTLSFIENKFKNDSQIAKANATVLQHGYNYGEITDTFTERYKIAKAKMKPGTYRNISGNQAIALGFLTASLKANKTIFFSGYPITPASDILQNLSSYKKYGVKTFQAEDEIAAIGAALGASFGGNIGITASSGPGIALKAETMGLAVMQELPLVIVNVQRAGPSTGLPTKTEQADLMQAMYGRNGEAPMPILAAQSPADCFNMAYYAVKFALEFNTPVILLSDGYNGNGAEPWQLPNIEDYPTIQSKIAKFEENETYLPYKRDDNFVREVAYPGTKGLEHIIGGLEKKNETGEVSYEAENHQLMVNLRKKKVEQIALYYPPLKLDSEAENLETLIISWGSTYGSVKTAVYRLKLEGIEISHLSLQFIHPFPLELKDLISSYKTVIVPELNDGQLIKILRDTFLVDCKGIHKVKGKPFTAEELVDDIKKLI